MFRSQSFTERADRVCAIIDSRAIAGEALRLTPIQTIDLCNLIAGLRDDLTVAEIALEFANDTSEILLDRLTDVARIALEAGGNRV